MQPNWIKYKTGGILKYQKGKVLKSLEELKELAEPLKRSISGETTLTKNGRRAFRVAKPSTKPAVYTKTFVAPLAAKPIELKTTEIPSLKTPQEILAFDPSAYMNALTSAQNASAMGLSDLSKLLYKDASWLNPQKDAFKSKFLWGELYRDGGVIKAQPGVGKAAAKVMAKAVKGTKRAKRDVKLEHWVRMHENAKNNVFSEFDVQNFLNAKNKGNYLDRTYDGRYALNVQDTFERSYLTGPARVKFMQSHPVKSLAAPAQTGKNSFAIDTWTTWDDQIKSASRDFARKYSYQFPDNWKTAVKYEGLDPSSGTIGYTEGTIIGPHTSWLPVENGQVKVAHSINDTSPLARIVEGHEAGHATGNYNDPYIFNYTKERGLINWDGVSAYHKDADKGEIGQHLGELPSYLGFKWDPVKNTYIDSFGQPRRITQTHINNYMQFLKKNNFNIDKSIWGNVIDKRGFVNFLNDHPFALALPVTGLGFTAITKEKQGGSIKSIF